MSTYSTLIAIIAALSVMMRDMNRQVQISIAEEATFLSGSIRQYKDPEDLRSAVKKNVRVAKKNVRFLKKELTRILSVDCADCADDKKAKHLKQRLQEALNKWTTGERPCRFDIMFPNFSHTFDLLEVSKIWIAQAAFRIS
jgi:hypothetical protein